MRITRHRTEGTHANPEDEGTRATGNAVARDTECRSDLHGVQWDSVVHDQRLGHANRRHGCPKARRHRWVVRAWVVAVPQLTDASQRTEQDVRSRQVRSEVVADELEVP